MNKIVISGALANKPLNGGNAWSRLSWVLGFKNLGFEVYFIEQIDPANCVDRSGTTTSFENSINRAYFKAVMDSFGLARSSALIYGQGEKVDGSSLDEVIKEIRGATLLFNISGHFSIPALTEPIRLKLYYDDDPGFTQFWEAGGKHSARVAGHDFYYTIGQNIGAPGCSIPTCDLAWRHTRPPVVLRDWPTVAPRPFDRFTTVASWRGAYGPVRWGAKTFGLKVHEFRKFIELPQHNGTKFEIALQIHPKDQPDLDSLLAHGWLIRDPNTVAASPEDFRHYVQNSAAEFSVAQGVYVDTCSGWFSDRTVRYLASGRPALVQDTGFSDHIPVGEGLVTFRTPAEAAQHVEDIVGDYPRHCRAAREVAERFFDSDIVISRIAADLELELP